jgi:hypothetical protein
LGYEELRKTYKGTKENKNEKRKRLGGRKNGRKQIKAKKENGLHSSAILCESRETGRKRDRKDEYIQYNGQESRKKNGEQQLGRWLNAHFFHRQTSRDIGNLQYRGFLIRD